MTRVLGVRLDDEQLERLNAAARAFQRSPEETAAALLEEALRECEFPFIEFRDSGLGREAYLAGTRLKVWHVAWLAEGYDHDAREVAAHLDMPLNVVEAALRYAERFSEEIAEAVSDNRQAAVRLRRSLPVGSPLSVDAPTV